MLITVSTYSQTEWKLVKSVVTFHIKNAGATVTGTLDSMTAHIKFDDANFFKSSIEASVRSNSIETGVALRNHHLREETYLDVAKYPKITMVSTLFAKGEKSGQYKGYFNLTIKNTTKQVVVPFEFTESGNDATFKASFTINRRDYNVGTGIFIMGDDVNVDIEVRVVKG